MNYLQNVIIIVIRERGLDAIRCICVCWFVRSAIHGCPLKCSFKWCVWTVLLNHNLFLNLKCLGYETTTGALIRLVSLCITFTEDFNILFSSIGCTFQIKLGLLSWLSWALRCECIDVSSQRKSFSRYSITSRW